MIVFQDSYNLTLALSGQPRIAILLPWFFALHCSAPVMHGSVRHAGLVRRPFVARWSERRDITAVATAPRSVRNCNRKILGLLVVCLRREYGLRMAPEARNEAAYEHVTPWLIHSRSCDI